MLIQPLSKHLLRVCLESLQRYFGVNALQMMEAFSLVSMDVRSSSELNGRHQLTREKEWPSADDLQG